MLPVRICAGGVGTTGVPTATGQHRDDDVNGPSRSGEHMKRKEAETIDPALLRRHTGVLRKSKN